MTLRWKRGAANLEGGQRDSRQRREKARKKENEKPRQPREHPEGCGSRKPSRNNKKRRLEANCTWKGYITLAPRTLAESGPDQGIILQNDGTLRKTKNLLSKQKNKTKQPSAWAGEGLEAEKSPWDFVLQAEENRGTYSWSPRNQNTHASILYLGKLIFCLFVYLVCVWGGSL